MQIAPQIIQNKISLEKERTHDHLNRRLSNRPAKVDLKLRNILRGKERTMKSWCIME